MILRTTESLDDTAEQTWRLRRLLAAIVSPIAATIRRAALLRTYEDEHPKILADIGLDQTDIEDARHAKHPASLLRRRYDLRRAWDVRTRPPFSRCH
ncbi:MAG: hypothetical protein AAFW98_12015 [Pseudomonadota bacterium]